MHLYGQPWERLNRLKILQGRAFESVGLRSQNVAAKAEKYGKLTSDLFTIG